MEDPRTEDIIADAKRAYDSLWSIIKLPAIVTTAIILLTAKVRISPTKIARSFSLSSQLPVFHL